MCRMLIHNIQFILVFDQPVGLKQLPDDPVLLRASSVKNSGEAAARVICSPAGCFLQRSAGGTDSSRFGNGSKDSRTMVLSGCCGTYGSNAGAFLMAQAKPQEKPVFPESEAGDAAVGFH